MTERTLTTRDLNRATLARQLLLERADWSFHDAIKHLVALQGQVSNAPYLGLWTRLRAFERAALTALLEQRQGVRASSLRGTLHLLLAEDYLWLHPLLQSTLSRNLHLFARKTRDFEMARFVEMMRTYVQEQPRTARALRARMEEFFPGMGQQQITDSVRMYLGLIQIPPAGLWGFTGQPVHVRAEDWLGRPPVSVEDGLPRLVHRYLAAFGPASAKDVQAWSGLSGIQPVLEKLRPELRVYRDERGRELFDLPDAPMPAPETPAPVRFLPAFDNLIYAYAERQRVIAANHQPFLSTGNLIVQIFLVDGFARGTWKIEHQGASTILVIEPFEPLSPSTQNELHEEGERLLRWAAADAETYDIRFQKARMS